MLKGGLRATSFVEDTFMFRRLVSSSAEATGLCLKRHIRRDAFEIKTRRTLICLVDALSFRAIHSENVE